jgi:hypothetical protein
LETNVQTSQNVEIVTKKEVSSRKFLNVLGIFLFGGFALTSITTPIPSYEIKSFFLFIFGSAIIYYLLVNIYSIGQIGRKIVFTVLILLGCFSIYMAFYLATNSIPH